MDKIVLALSTRTESGKANAKLRSAGITPGVVYGHGNDSEAISVPTKELTKAYQEAGGNKIIDARQKNALIHDVQHHPLTGVLTHADFYLVRMDEKLTTNVPLHFVGESTAVYQLEGVLLTNMETVEVEALPAKLPENIEVDISILDDFEKAIHVSDLVAPEGVEILDDPEALIVRVEAPRTDEEIAELETDVTEVLPEGVAEEAPAGDVADGEKTQ